MKSVSIAEARRLANEAGATRLLIVCLDDDGAFSFTTFGKTRAQCQALKEWAECKAVSVAVSMDDA